MLADFELEKEFVVDAVDPVERSFADAADSAGESFAGAAFVAGAELAAPAYSFEPVLMMLAAAY